LAAEVIKALLERVPELDPLKVEDVVMGCAMPEGEQGMNVGRLAALLAGLSHEVPAMTVNRFCSSGAQTIGIAADRIANGGIDVAIAGGTETMSMIPMGGNKVSANPELMQSCPEAYISMGATAELVAQRFEISREDQDAFANESHRRAVEAWEKGIFENEVIAVETTVQTPGGPKKVTVTRDECPRPQTTLEGLAKLRPVFDPKGSVTAGNASPLTDGASVALLMDKETADGLGVKTLGRFVTYAVVGVPPEIMGIGPVPAIRKLLEKTGLSVEDIDAVELNEAFASQAVYCVRELGFDPAKVNPNGGAIAIGHPLGTTGARQVGTLLRHLKRTGGRYGIVSMCIGGGMGFAALVEA
jgi:acetyl-CoA acyltransferase